MFSTLKRKFELEGFEVLDETSTEQPDLIVIGKHENVLALPQQSEVPIIMLSNDELGTTQSIPSIAHLKMPFRPSQLMALARQAVTASL